MNNIDIIQIAKKVHNAFLKTMNLDTETKNKALYNISQKLKENKLEILNANNEDLNSAKELLESGEINKAVYERLKLN